MFQIRPALRRFFQSFVPIFTPPFSGLWVVAFLYFVWCFIVYPHSVVMRGNLPDPDDYMYLVQVIDWINGQGWYDTVQHRMNAPDGVPIHFSRLAQMPLAFFILLFQKMGLPIQGAAQVTALVVPLLYFVGLFLALRWVAESFVPRRWAGATAYIALFSWQLAYLFMPGRVDHHGLVIVLVALILGCLVRVIENPAAIRYALAAGALMALGMVVALEILPCILVFTVWLGIWAVVRGGHAARAMLVFGVVFYVGCLVGLVITRPPALLWDADVLTYSVVYVWLALGVAITCVVIFLLAQASPFVRFIGAFIAAVACGAWFLSSFPALWAGPYGGLDPAVARIILGEMTETKPLLGKGGSAYFFMFYATQLVMACCAALVIMRSRLRQQGWEFGLVTVMLLVLSFLTVFYQRRYGGLAQMVAVIPLTIMLVAGFAWLKIHTAGRGKFLAELGLLIVVAPLSTVLLPALFDGRSFNTGVLLAPAHGIGNQCDMAVLERVLRDPRYFGDRPRVILNGIGMGPELLFRTQHSVLSAPFHMNVQGNLDATRFFSTIYPQEAEGIVRRRHVDLVVMCNFVPDLYIRPLLGEAAKDGKYRPDIAPHMIERLMLNKAPAWLRRINVRGVQEFILYEVVPLEHFPLK